MCLPRTAAERVGTLRMRLPPGRGDGTRRVWRAMRQWCPIRSASLQNAWWR